MPDGVSWASKSTILYTLYEGKLFITIHWFLTHFLWSFIPIYEGDPFIFKSFNPHKRLLLKNNNHKDGGISLVLGIMYSNPVSISRVNIPRPKTTSTFYATFTGGMISHQNFKTGNFLFHPHMSILLLCGW